MTEKQLGCGSTDAATKKKVKQKPNALCSNSLRNKESRQHRLVLWVAVIAVGLCSASKNTLLNVLMAALAIMRMNGRETRLSKRMAP